ncbi:MAG: hypothetical protein IIW48_03890 [Clostridia bacterium]|nr:hypothetical protein [Clostridia bacterium]
MSMLSSRDYEAIVAYDHEHNPKYKAALVIEPSYRVVVLCVYDEKGNSQIKNIWGAGSDAVCFENEIKTEFDYVLYETEIKNAVRTYYLSNKCVDNMISEINRTASDVVNQFSNVVGNTLNVYFESADAVLSDAGIELQKLRIILVGGLANYFPAQVSVRLHYSSAMPMMPDARYGVYNEISDVIEKGLGIIDQKRTRFIDGAVEWSVFSDDGHGNIQRKKLTIAEDGTELDKLARPKFTSKVFVCGEDEIEISSAGSVRKFSVPERFLTDNMGTICLALQYDEEAFWLVVNSGGETEKYPIKVSVKGD